MGVTESMIQKACILCRPPLIFDIYTMQLVGEAIAYFKLYILIPVLV